MVKNMNFSKKSKKSKKKNNYCSLIWGFAAKSHIESLFSEQKQGMRAIMPGYVNYWYDNEI